MAVLSMVGFIGCANTESIPSDDLYSVISERRMPEYCRQKVAAEFGYYANDIFLHPIEYDKGTKLIYGKYRVGEKDLKEFVCIFNADDSYAGIKLRHSNVSSELCYPY